MRRAVSLIVTGLLAGTGTVVAQPFFAGPASAAAAEPDPVIGAPVFNNPAGDPTAQYAIFQQLARLIDRVPAGETIEMSWFEFKTPDYADTAAKPNIATRLVNAHQRGVNVRIVLDNTATVVKDGVKKPKTDANAVMPPYLKLKPELGTNPSASSFIQLCGADTGCIGRRKVGDANAYNHNKFLTASRVVLNDGTAKTDVVFQSSGNLGTWDADTVYNNAITWSEASSYANYRAYFADLKKYGAASAGNDNYYRVGASADVYKTHFFPRQPTNGDLNQASTDTIVSVLDSVKCSYTGEADGKTHQTDIRVAMWSLKRIAVGRKLVALAEAGCWVDVVYTETTTDIENLVAAFLEDHKDKMGFTRCGADFGGRNIRVHSKYMLIDGAYDDDQVPRVFTGSHNYSLTALRNADESMVRVRSAAVHYAYQHDNFYQLRDFCRANTKPATAATVLSDESEGGED